MITHEPKDYNCPLCNFVNGVETDHNGKQDIVYQDQFTTAFIAPTEWYSNLGHVLVIPKEHYENIYTIPVEKLMEVYKTVKKVAIAIRNTYGCNGISTRQHNEPAGDQDVWHYHVHVFPRYINDNLYANHEKRGFVGPEERLPYAKKLKAYFEVN